MPSYNVKPPKPVKAPTFELAVKQVIEDKTAIEESANKIAELAKAEGNVEIQEEFVSIAGLASKGREALVAKLREHMANSAPKEYVPPPPSERQLSRTQMEMEAGKRALEKHKERAALQLQPKHGSVPASTDGYTVPVYRPADHVPGFDSKDPGARTLK